MADIAQENSLRILSWLFENEVDETLKTPSANRPRLAASTLSACKHLSPICTLHEHIGQLTLACHGETIMKDPAQCQTT